MAEEAVTKSAPETDGNLKTWKRRGLLAAAWAAVMSIVAKQTTQPLQAGVDGDVVLGAANMATQPTSITNDFVFASADTHALEVFSKAGTRGIGLFAEASAYGVWGSASVGTLLNPATTKTVGVYGESRDPTGFGVWGECLDGVGLVGDGGDRIGIIGQSVGSGAGGYGILGLINGLGPVSPSPNNTVAIYGANYSRWTGTAPGQGGFGVYGISATGPGLLGATAAAGAAAVVGATNGVAGAYAGVFYGPVVVQGAFTVVGGPKSAAVPHPDGSHRLLYCMESPESWFEDFGTGSLECGQAEVRIDPDFAAVSEMEGYQVFLTGYDHDHALHVTNRTQKGFTVRADVALARLKGQPEDQLSGAFGWRIVAKRKDVGGERLAKITIPPEPKLPAPPMHDANIPPHFRSRIVPQ